MYRNCLTQEISRRHLIATGVYRGTLNLVYIINKLKNLVDIQEYDNWNRSVS